MSEITLDETKLKELLKAAIFELLKEQKEVFSEILTEALEDIGMENAIKEGENTETVSRDRIFKIKPLFTAQKFKLLEVELD